MSLVMPGAKGFVVLGLISLREGDLISYFTNNLRVLSSFLKQRLNILKTDFQSTLKAKFPSHCPLGSRILMN